MSKYNVSILGASYGSLLGIKLAVAGHSVKLVCLPDEAALINAEGIRVRLPVRGLDQAVELDSRALTGSLVTATTPAELNPGEYDLIVMAMQEPQYRASEVSDLLKRIAAAGVPCMSIMNMPPLPYMARLPGIDADSLRDCYTDASVWDALDPSLVTLASPDPQAFRPPQEKTNVLQVSLPTNFKVARFDSDEHTAMLKMLQADIEGIRYDTGREVVELPVKLKVHESLYVPLAKWSMLLTGNYRCVLADSVRPIREAVHSNPENSRAVYQWVADLCKAIGADASDLVPFEKYANAARGLAKPSSVARALDAGATHVERVDLLVNRIADQLNLVNPAVEEITRIVDGRINMNREKLKRRAD